MRERDLTGIGVSVNFRAGNLPERIPDGKSRQRWAGAILEVEMTVLLNSRLSRALFPSVEIVVIAKVPHLHIVNFVQFHMAIAKEKICGFHFSLVRMTGIPSQF